MNDSSAIKAPLVPPAIDVRSFPAMQVDIPRLFGSEFHAVATDSEWRAGVTLWLKSFHQVPAASLPNDDIQLARLADLGRDVGLWRSIRGRALHGFVVCSDGRLYHPVVAEKALEVWLRKLARRAGANSTNKTGLEDQIRDDVRIAAECLHRLNPNNEELNKKIVVNSGVDFRSANAKRSHSETPSGRSTERNETKQNRDSIQKGGDLSGTRVPRDSRARANPDDPFDAGGA